MLRNLSWKWRLSLIVLVLWFLTFPFPKIIWLYRYEYFRNFLVGLYLLWKDSVLVSLGWLILGIAIALIIGIYLDNSKEGVFRNKFKKAKETLGP